MVIIMIEKLKRVFLNKNLICAILFVYFLNVHFKITENNYLIYSAMAERNGYNDIFQLNYNYGIAVKWFALIFAIIILINIGIPKNLKQMFTDTKFTKFNKFILLPFTIFYILYVFHIGIYGIQTKTEYIKDLAMYPEVHDITLSEFENAEDFKTAVVYIESEDCQDCAEISQIIDDISKDYKIDVYKYNTIHDSNTNKEELDEVLKKYDIDAVPTVLIVIDGKIDKTLTGQDAFELYEIIEGYKQDGLGF